MNLAERLLREKILTREQLGLALKRQQKMRGYLAKHLLELNLVEAEVLARAEQVLRRVEASRLVAGGKGELAGNLAQIPLVDLLQVLGLNRKSGWSGLENLMQFLPRSLAEFQEQYSTQDE